MFIVNNFQETVDDSLNAPLDCLPSDVTLGSDSGTRLAPPTVSHPLRQEISMNLGSIKPVLAALALLATAGAFAQKTQLTVYTALETDQLKAYEAGFVKDNPTIEIKWVRDSTGVITAKLLAEKANPQADVVMGVAASSLALLDKQGMLVPYAPLNLDAIMSQYRDKKSPPAWFGMDVWGATVCFNTVDAQQYTHSGSKPCNMAATGEYVMGISFEYRGNTNKAKGAPIDLVFPKEGLGWDLEAFAIHSGTKKLDAAKKLADWASSKDAMKLYGKNFAITAIPGVAEPLKNVPADYEKRLVKMDFATTAANRERVLAEWNKRYDAKSEPKK